MSCECEHDAVQEVLEALADARGYQLVPKAPDLLSEATNELQVQFGELSTDQVITRVRALADQEKLLDQALSSVQKLYKERLFDLKGLYLPESYHVRPPMLFAEIQIAHRLTVWGLQYLAKRLADDCLTEVTGAADVEHAIADLKRPQRAPANPAA